MIFSNYDIDSLFEEVLSSDDSGFGEPKIDLPDTEGFATSIRSAEQSSNASDAQNTDIDLSFNQAFPKDTSGFGEDADLDCDAEEEIDFTTIPATNFESDQFSDDDENIPVDSIDPSDLADDIDDEELDESAVDLDWNDLF